MRLMSLTIAAVAVAGAAHATEPYELSSVELEAVKDGVSREMRDPSSAIFGDIFAAKTANDDGAKVCGHVNGKNGFGGYSGMILFDGEVFPTDSGGAFFYMTGIGDTQSAAHFILERCQERGVSIVDLGY